MLYLCAMHSPPFYGLYMGVMGMYGTLGIWTNRIRSIPDYTGLLGAPEGQLVQGAKWVKKALEPAEHECQDSQFCTKGRLHGCLLNRLTKGRLLLVISRTYRTSQ